MTLWKRVTLPLAILLGLSCAGNPPAVDPTQEATFFPETISLTGLEVSDSGESTEVTVTGNFPFNYSSFEPDPSRLVIEIPGAEASALAPTIPIGTSRVDQVLVTTEEYPGGSRIARLEFTGVSGGSHQVSLEESQLRVRFLAGPAVATETGFGETGWTTQEGAGEEGQVPLLEPVGGGEAAPVSGSPAQRLLDLRVESPGVPTSVRLVADGRLEFRDFRLEDPERAVVDLIGVANQVSFRSLPVGSEFVNQVRVAQFQGEPEKITRVVFDLATEGEYSILPTPDGLRVEFPPAPPAAATEPSVPPLLAEAVPESGTPVTEPEAAAEPGAGETAFEGSAADEATDADGEEAMPPEDAEEDATETPEEDVPSGPDEPSVAAPVAPAAAAPAMAAGMQVDANTFILKAAQDPYTAQTISGRGSQYSGPRISLDFKDADLKDVFRLFHEILGYNIVLDPGVSGKLTIVLDDVPADQALDIILKNNGLDKVFENNVIRVATTQKLAQEAAARRQLFEARELEDEPVTFARKLSYAKASDVVKLLREAGGTGASGGILSKKGNVKEDERTNTLIITDIPKNIDPINRLVDVLDEETPQVMIEARIVETDRDFERDFGISWGWEVDLDPAIGTETNARFPHRVNVDYEVNLPPPAASTSLGLSFGNIRDSWDLSFTLEAFELNGDVKILSSPRIATQNNETAVIEQGVQIPVVNTTATEINVEFISASLRLEVTPQITKDNTIIMDVKVDNSSPDFGNRVGDVPPIITERAETLILVENGGTAVIGGIFKLDEAFTEIGVPGLKRIPLLGWLFKNRSVTRGNTELLIFLTPRILTRS